MRKYHFYVICLLVLVLSLCASSPIRALWISGGVLVSAGSNNRQPKIVKDGERGAIIAWCNDTQTYVQRVGFIGDCKWPVGGVLLSPTGTDPQIVADGVGGAVIAWQDVRNGNPDIYTQKVDSLGSVLWPSSGVAVCTVDGIQGPLRMVTDCSGGAIISWEDERDGDMHIYAQRIDTDGNALWAADGVRIDTGAGTVYAPDIDSDDCGGAYITWAIIDTATTEYLDRKILLAKINSDGYLAWNSHEVTCDVWPTPGPDIEWSFPEITRDGYGGAIVAWVTEWLTGGIASYVLAQKVDALGLVCWEEGGVAVSGAVLPHGVQLKPDGLGGAVITWFCIDDVWTAIYDILAGRIDSDGLIVWTDRVFFSVNGTNYALRAREYHLNDNGRGKFFLAWERGLYLDEDMLWRSDIFANRLDRDGVMWLGNGLYVCGVDGDQRSPQIVSIGDGSSITVWEDARGDGSIYAQLLNAWGEPPIATLLQSHCSTFDGEKAVIEWTLSETGEEMQFFVLRAEGDEGAFEEIPHPVIERIDMTFTFTDGTCEPGTVYRYRVEVEDEMDRRLLFESDPVTISPIPLTFYQNYPNPFNTNTTIRYYLPEPGPVVLEIYDVAGRKIIELVNKEQAKGRHQIEWDGRDAGGTFVGSGIYFSRLRADKKVVSKKLVMIR